MIRTRSPTSATLSPMSRLPTIHDFDQLVDHDDADRDRREQDPAAERRSAPGRACRRGSDRRPRRPPARRRVRSAVPRRPRARRSSPGHRGPSARRSAMRTSPASRRTTPPTASAGAASRRTSSTSVSTRHAPRDGARRPVARPSTQSTIRSSSSSSASLRRSWTARWSSRASPSATSSGVSVVSMIATRPSSWATAVPGRGVAWISTSSRRQRLALDRHRAVRMELEPALARRRHHGRDLRARGACPPSAAAPSRRDRRAPTRRRSARRP